MHASDKFITLPLPKSSAKWNYITGKEDTKRGGEKRRNSSTKEQLNNNGFLEDKTDHLYLPKKE